MSDQDALGADMHPLPGSLAGGPPAGDQDTLERLLDGPIDPGSVPPGYGGLARLLAAATAPAAAQELAGEQRALGEFTAVLRSTPTRSPGGPLWPASCARSRRPRPRWWPCCRSAGSPPQPPATSPARHRRWPTSQRPPPPPTRPPRGLAGRRRQPGGDGSGRSNQRPGPGVGGRARRHRSGPGRAARPGRPARVTTTDAGWTRWPSRRWRRPPVGLATSPATARTSPPVTRGRARRRHQGSRPHRPAPRHRAAAHPRTRAHPPAAALEDTGKAAPQPPPADRPPILLTTVER